MKRERKVFRKRYAGMAEYIIILALVAIGSIAVFQMFGNQIRALIGASTEQLAGEDTQAEDLYDGSNTSGEIDKAINQF
jgi:Flp pilus assembly pilin Flp